MSVSPEYFPQTVTYLGEADVRRRHVVQADVVALEHCNKETQYVTLRYNCDEAPLIVRQAGLFVQPTVPPHPLNKFPAFYSKPNVHYRAHNIHPHVPVKRLINPVFALPSYFFKKHFNIILHLFLGLPDGICP